MYWSDWGNHPKIETAAMDGTMRETLVENNIQWPTGINNNGCHINGWSGLTDLFSSNYNRLMFNTFLQVIILVIKCLKNSVGHAFHSVKGD